MRVAVLFLVVAAVTASETNKVVDPRERGPGFARVYEQVGQLGDYEDFFDYDRDLKKTGWDDRISALCQTGIWFFYENKDYNKAAGDVVWTHGWEFCDDFVHTFQNKASSLRYGGSSQGYNDDSFTLFEGAAFSGSEYYGDQGGYPTLSFMDKDASSALLVGGSAWTFYTAPNYGGDSVCAVPDTDHDIDAEGKKIDIGFFPQITELGLEDNSIRSVAKGCFSTKIVHAQRLHPVRRTSKGSIGVIRANEH